MEKKKGFLIEEIPLGLTFDDVLLIPQYSDISSRSECIVDTRLSRNISLKVPFVSSPMDTVTETEMAIEMARLGGLGVIHRFCSIEDQSKMIAKVKRAETYFISDPIVLHKNSTIEEAIELSEQIGINSFLIIDSDKKKNNSDPETQYWKRKESKIFDTLAGILTRRDFKFALDKGESVSKYMTPRDKLICYETKFGKAPPADELKSLMLEKKIEKVPIVNEKNEILGLVTLKDIINDNNITSNKDSEGQLIVGGAIGAKEDYLERANSLILSGCDVLIVDIANGHNKMCIDVVKELKESYPKIDVIAGSVATGEGALNLIKAGADGIRCGIGNGSICITRIVSGCGVPQLSALLDVAPICKEYDIPLMSDGGNRTSGNMCKALAAGASCIMLGRLVAGCEESPSKIIYRDGKLCKIYRGMAGYGANVSKQIRTGGKELKNNFTPEGVEGVIPYAGPLKDVLSQFINGVKSGMSYCGAHNIVELWKNHQFIRITNNGSKESGVHDITKL